MVKSVIRLCYTMIELGCLAQANAALTCNVIRGEANEIRMTPAFEPSVSPTVSIPPKHLGRISLLEPQLRVIYILLCTAWLP
jgi:hypothetical protein